MDGITRILDSMPTESVKQVFARIPAGRRIDLYGFLITLIQSGYDIQGATGEVAKTLEREAADTLIGKGELIQAAKLYRFIESEQRQGRPLHVALAGRVPDAEIMMLLAGSQGDIVQGLEAAQKSAKDNALKNKIIAKSVTYPLVIMAVTIFAMSWLGKNLMPTMTKLKPVEQWAPSEQNLYWLTTNVGSWTPIVVLAAIALLAGVLLVNRYVVGRSRESFHKMPPFNVIRKVTAATYLGTLSSLVKAGLPTKDALISMRRSTNSEYLRFYLNESLNNFRAGLASEGPGKAIASRLFSPWVMVKLDVYSRAGADKFANTMTEIADDATEEAMGTIQGLSKLINILLMCCAAGVIGFTVVTMYGITSSLQSGIS